VLKLLLSAQVSYPL